MYGADEVKMENTTLDWDSCRDCFGFVSMFVPSKKKKNVQGYVGVFWYYWEI